MRNNGNTDFASMLNRRLCLPTIHVSSGVWITVIHRQVRHHLVQHSGVLHNNPISHRLHRVVSYFSTYQRSSGLGIQIKRSTLHRTLFVLITNGSCEMYSRLPMQYYNSNRLLIETHIFVRRLPIAAGRKCAKNDDALRDTTQRSSTASTEAS